MGGKASAQQKPIAVVTEPLEEYINMKMAKFKEDLKVGRKVKRDWEDKYMRLGEEFKKAEMEKAKRGVEELKLRISRLEEDKAVLVSVEPTVEEKRSDVGAAELVRDGKERESEIFQCRFTVFLL